MSGDATDDKQFEHLRQKAEEVLQNREAETGADYETAQIHEVLHELHVHQVELGMQNDELARARNELERSRDRYQRLYDYAPVGYVTLASDGRVTHCNLTFCAMLQRRRDAIIGANLARFISDSSRQAYLQLLSRLRVGEIEVEFQRVGRSELWALLRAEPRFDPDGGFVEHWLSATEITQRHRAEAALAEHAERLRLVIEGGKLGTWDRDLESDETIWNDTLCALLGRSPAEPVSGETFFEYIHPDDLPRVRENVERWLAAKDGDEFSDEFRVVRDDGELRWLAASGRVYRDGDGRPLRVSGVNYDITNRVRTEQALRDSEELYRTLAANLPGGAVFVVDHDLRYVLAEGEALSEAGFTSSDLEGHSLAEALGPELAGQYEPLYRQALAGEPFQVEHHSHGRAYASRGVPIRDNDGRVTHVLAMSYDITERKRTEEDLRQSREQFRIMGEAVDYGVWLCDKDGQALYASQSFLDLLDMTMEEMQGFGWTRRLVPEDLEPMMERWMHCVRTGEPWDSEHRVIDRDGVVHTILTRGKPVRDRGGEIVSWAGINLDITDRKRVEQDLRRSEAQAKWLARFPDENPSPVVRVSAEGAVLYANPVAVAHPGWRCQVGEPLPDAPLRHLVGKAIADQETLDEDVDLAGTPFSVVLVPVGTECYVNLYARDISDRVGAEQDLRRSNEQLEHRVAERTAELRRRSGQLARLALELTLAEQRERKRIADVLHDNLQQLLFAASMQVDMLRESSAGRKLRPTLDAIYGIVDDAIDTSRTLSRELAPPVLHQEGLVPALDWLARWMEEKHGLTVEVETQDDKARLDILQEDVRVLLYTSIRELLFNVVKHSGVDYAQLSVARPDDHLAVTVTDNGDGFDLQALDADDRPGGGFGLVSIRERLHLLGGRMEVHSAPGKGASFTLIVPLSIATEMASADAALGVQPRVPEHRRLPRRKGMPSGPPPPGGSIRVILADDHAVVRQGLRLLLESQSDMEVVGEAANGAEAVGLALKLEPDVILMDATMPVMTGVEATRRIARQLPDCRIIALSMHEEPDIAAHMRAAGAQTFLTKTGDASALLGAIRSPA